MSMNDELLTGLLLDEECLLTLGELSRACTVHAECIVELVQEGILEPRGDNPVHWRFTGSSLPRAHAAIRLQRDLDINLAGVALALELLDEIDTLRSRLRVLDQEYAQSNREKQP